MKPLKLFALVCIIFYQTGLFAKTPAYKLVWSDEFNQGIKPDTANWNYEKGFVRNQEDQWYQEENAFIEDGILIIEARKEYKDNPNYKEGSKHWTSARKNIKYSSSSIHSRGKFEFQFGRLEVRARIDTSIGLWPAIWTLGIDKQWPSNGEIDLMESYPISGVHHILANVASGTEKQYIAKWHSTTKALSYFLEKDSLWPSKFHVWRMDWDQNKIQLYLDDELLNEVSLSKTLNPDGFQPFHQAHYILLNLALGGQNGGSLSNTKFPNRYEIDYVRVYKQAIATY